MPHLILSFPNVAPFTTLSGLEKTAADISYGKPVNFLSQNIAGKAVGALMKESLDDFLAQRFPLKATGAPKRTIVGARDLATRRSTCSSCWS
jgi:hypothetical protein